MRHARTISAAAKTVDLGDVVRELQALRAVLGEQSAGALGREAAANFLGISTATLDRLTSAGKIRSVRVSEGRVVWRRVDLEKYLAELVE